MFYQRKNVMHDFIRTIRSWAGILLLSAGTAWAAPAAAPAPQNEPSLEKILSLHVKAMGDVRNWDGIQMVRMAGRFELQQPGVRFSEWRRKPNLLRVQWTSPQRETVLDVGCNSQVAWYVSRAGGKIRRSTIPAAQASALKRKAVLEDTILRESRTVLRNWDRLDDQTVNGAECYVLRHSPLQEPVETLFLDKKTLYILRREVQTDKGVEIEEFGDYRPVNDIPWPHRLTFFEDGQKSEVAIVESIQVNPGISSLFFRPPPEAAQPAQPPAAPAAEAANP